MARIADSLTFEGLDKRTVIIINSHFRNGFALALILKNCFLWFTRFEVLHDPSSYIFLMDFHIPHASLYIFFFCFLVTFNLKMSQGNKSKSTATPRRPLKSRLCLNRIFLFMVCCDFRGNFRMIGINSWLIFIDDLGIFWKTVRVTVVCMLGGIDDHIGHMLGLFTAVKFEFWTRRRQIIRDLANQGVFYYKSTDIKAKWKLFFFHNNILSLLQ